MKKEILITGIIFLFIGVGIQPAFALTQTDIDMDVEPVEEIETEPSGLLWGTYKDCYLIAEYTVEGPSLNRFVRRIFWRIFFGIDFLFYIYLRRIEGTLYGAEGKVNVSSVRGFGFTIDFILPHLDPEEPGIIQGHFQFCIYR